MSSTYQLLGIINLQEDRADKGIRQASDVIELYVRTQRSAHLFIRAFDAIPSIYIRFACFTAVAVASCRSDGAGMAAYDGTGGNRISQDGRDDIEGLEGVKKYERFRRVYNESNAHDQREGAARRRRDAVMRSNMLRWPITALRAAPPSLARACGNYCVPSLKGAAGRLHTILIVEESLEIVFEL